MGMAWSVRRKNKKEVNNLSVTKECRKKQIAERLGEFKINNEGCLMTIVEYNNIHNIIVEFQDNHKSKIHTNYEAFLKGQVKNPYHTSVYGVGVIGIKYPVSINRKHTKEYITWNNMLKRCFDKEYKNKHSTYKNATCCNEWLYYENFYEWLHSQENFEKWLNGSKWDLDKDILVKNNKIYSPNLCCLIPNNINKLFTKSNITRGILPIGVNRVRNKFQSSYLNQFTGKKEYLGLYNTPEEAFQVYKEHKEKLIKNIAKIEYNKGNIIKSCYNAMINYVVEIND